MKKVFLILSILLGLAESRLYASERALARKKAATDAAIQELTAAVALLKLLRIVRNEEVQKRSERLQRKLAQRREEKEAPSRAQDAAKGELNALCAAVEEEGANAPTFEQVLAQEKKKREKRQRQKAEKAASAELTLRKTKRD